MKTRTSPPVAVISRIGGWQKQSFDSVWRHFDRAVYQSLDPSSGHNLTIIAANEELEDSRHDPKIEMNDHKKSGNES